MWKNGLRAAAFALIFAMLFLWISPVFIPKNNSGGAGIHQPDSKGFLAEPENTIDVLFVGDSETYSAFIPLRIWEQYGISSYVCSTGSQMMYQAYSYLEWFLKEQNPKVVVLETNALYREFSVDRLLAHLAEEKFLFLRYHDRWKHLKAEDWSEDVAFTRIVRDKGYVYKTEIKAADTTGYMAPSEEAEPITLLNRVYAEKIRDLCREEGIELILVSTPSPVNWSSYYHNGVTALAEELGLLYVDMNVMPEAVPIDWEKDSFDAGDHMNYTGACKVTDYIAAVLAQRDVFEDKRGDPAYKDWNDALAEFHEELKKEP